MKTMKVRVLNGAESDLEDYAEFWELQEEGLGIEFVECIRTELRLLATIGGIHLERRAVFRMPVQGKFPYYSVYYRIRGETVTVAAIVDMRRDPAWVRAFLSRRLRD